MVKVKILIEDGIPALYPPGYTPRWKVGDIGELLENDFSEKYDYKVQLPGVIHIDDLFGTGPVDALRVYYFYKGEIEIINEE